MDLILNKDQIIDETFQEQVRHALDVLELSALPETHKALSDVRLEKLKSLKPRDAQSVHLMLKQDKYIGDIQKSYNFLNTHFELAARLLHSKDMKATPPKMKHV
jgi:hypothetical protein